MIKKPTVYTRPIDILTKTPNNPPPVKAEPCSACEKIKKVLGLK